LAVAHRGRASRFTLAAPQSRHRSRFQQHGVSVPDYQGHGLPRAGRLHNNRLAKLHRQTIILLSFIPTKGKIGMPFVAHNEDWILGYGNSPREAENRMRRDYPDLEPTVTPATKCLVRSLESCPLSDAQTGKLYMEVHHVGGTFDGVMVLAEEFQVLKLKKDRYGFSYHAVRAEIEALRPPSSQ
jgi:hypothetical protein